MAGLKSQVVTSSNMAKKVEDYSMESNYFLQQKVRTSGAMG